MRVATHCGRMGKKTNRPPTNPGQSILTPGSGLSIMDQLPNACDQRVSVLQTDDYVAVSPHTPLSQAIEAMKGDEGGCVIVSGAGRVAGIFTERSRLTKHPGGNADVKSLISKWVQPNVEALSPESTYGEAVSLMNERSLRKIPLV